MANCTPFIPAKLDDADLTPHEFRVFCHISRRGECTASIGTMSGNIGISEPTVRDALKTLRSAEMIECEERPGTTNKYRTRPTEEWDLPALCEPNETEDPSQDFGDPRKLPLQKVRDHPSQLFGDHPSQDIGGVSKGYPLEGNPLEGAIGVSGAEAPLPSYLLDVVDRISWQAEPLPDDHEVTWEYHPGDWRWEAANYVLRELWADQRLPSRLNRRLEEGDVKPGKIASKWADTFRLLVEQDGYSREVIRYTIRWLFEIDDWWIESGNFQSASNSALRRRDQDGTHKFDKLVQRARSHYEQQKRKQTDAEEIRRGWSDAIEEYEANRPAESTGDAIPSEPEVGGAAV